MSYNFVYQLFLFFDFSGGDSLIDETVHQDRIFQVIHILSTYVLAYICQFLGIPINPKPEKSNRCCKTGKVICFDSCNSGAATARSELYGEYKLGPQTFNGRAFYESKDKKIALSWDNVKGVWNLGNADQRNTAWAWSNDDVSCPDEIENWSYWDENNQVQNAFKTLTFDCLAGKFYSITPNNGKQVKVIDLI